MPLESTAEERGLFVCRRCEHRAEVEIDTSAEVLVDEASRQGPLTSLGLVRCPACGRRDTRVVLVEAMLPAFGGLLIAPVLAFVLVLVGMLVIAGPDVRQNEARFPYLLTVAVVAGLLGGGGFLAWHLGRAFRRAAQNVSFGRTAPQGVPPYRTQPALPALGRPSFLVPEEQRSNFALGLVSFSALAIGFMGLGSSLPGRIGLGVAVAVVAGAIRGNSNAERAVFSLAFTMAEAGIVVATSLYTQGRSSVWNVELLVPLLLGAIPGGVVYLLAMKLVRPGNATSVDVNPSGPE
jgi:hypothetical protein